MHSKSRSSSAFTLLELLIVIAILSIIIVATTGAWRRYNAQTDLHLAAQRLVKELADAQVKARAFSVAQMRAGTSPPVLTAGNVQIPGTFVKADIMEAGPGQNLTVASEWWVGEQQGSAVPLTMTTSNLPALPYATNDGTTDQGLTLQLGQTSSPNSLPQVLASVAFQPDGTILVINSTTTTSIILGNSYSNQTISLTPLGVASLQDGP